MARAAGMLVLIVTVALALSVLIGKLRGDSFVLGLVASILWVLLPVAVWLFVSWHMPHAPDVPWTALLPGAVVFGVGLEVLHLVTVYWIARDLEHKTSTYGAIGFALGVTAVGVPARPVGDHVGGDQRDAVVALPGAAPRPPPSPGAHRPVVDLTRFAHESSRHAAGHPGRLRREDRRGERQHEHVARDEGHHAPVEAGLGAEGGDDQGELAAGEDRGGEVGRLRYGSAARGARRSSRR